MIVEEIVELAMETADAAQAIMRAQETSAVDFENDKLKSAESSQRTDIVVKVIVDGKVGTSTTTDPNGYRRGCQSGIGGRRIWV